MFFPLEALQSEADNRLTVFLLKRGFGTLTFELLKAVDFIKRIRRH